MTREQLHNYLGITSSSPNSITIMRRLGKDTGNRKMREIQTNICAKTYLAGTCYVRVTSTQAKGNQSRSHTK